MPTDDPALPRYLAEWFIHGLSEQTITDATTRLRLTLTAMPVEPCRPALIYAAYVPQDDYAFMVFAADSAERVARACAAAGFPADRVTAALEAPPVPH